MFHVLNRLTVRTRIWVIVAIFLGGFALDAVIEVSMLREALWHEKLLLTRQAVESGFSVLAHYHDLQKKGELTEAAAQAAAIRTLKRMRYGEGEYFWLNDTDVPFPRMVMHPTVPELEGRVLDAKEFARATAFRADPAEGPLVPTDGNANLFAIAVQVANAGRGGHITYSWPRPMPDGGVTAERYSKLSYVKKFEAWGWVIGSGIYVDDIARALRAQAVRQVAVLAGLGVVLLVLAFIVARSIIRPLQLTVATMRTIGKDAGGLALRLPVEGPSEISELACGFNEMLGRLQVRDSQLAHQRAGLEEEVAHRTAEIQDTNRQLERELGERKRVEQDLRESRARMRALLDASNESVLLLDPEGTILAINVFAAQRFGQRPEAMAGKNFFDVIPPDLAATRRLALQQVVAAGEPCHNQDQRGGIFFDNSLYPVKNESGDVESVAVYARDITEQHRAKELDDIFGRLNTVLLKWRMDLGSVAQMFCDHILPVFDLTAAWIARAEKDGRLIPIAGTEAARGGLLERVRERALRWSGDPLCFEPAGQAVRTGYPQLLAIDGLEDPGRNAVVPVAGARSAILLPLTLGGERWGVLVLYGRHERQFEGAELPRGLASIASRLGVSLESAVQQEWLTLLDTALAAVSNAVYITDATASILWANRAFGALSGYPANALLGKTPRLFNSGSQGPEFYARFWETIAAGRVWHGDVVNARPDGQRYVASQTVTPLLDGNGEVTHYVTIVEDITERKAAEERMQHTANFDLLTDLPNRSLFLDRLGQALALARREGQMGALLFLDLDHFKQVNDELGHAAGDRLLVEVGGRLREEVRESDTVARLGGDEFTVILPHVRAKEDAACVAEKILSGATRPFSICARDLRVGVSIGIAFFPEHGNSVESILNAADHAMYLAKKGGRSCYVFADGEAEGSESGAARLRAGQEVLTEKG